MAKDGKKKETKKKTTGKTGGRANPIPKEFGGIKVPKELRKAGKKAIELVKDPVVSEVVAAALLSAAAALRAPAGDKNGPSQATGRSARPGPNPNPIGDTLKGLAVDLARRTIEGVGDRQRARGRKAEPRTPESSDT